MNTVITLWKFSRPHTIIGSAISIVTLYIIICQDCKADHLFLLLMALTIGITCNIFIVGINQIADVHIDKINKPYLPIPAGALSIREAKIIVVVSLLLSLILALIISPYLFLIIFLSAVIGWAYSMPPIYLKKHHLTAALAITFVRGILINLGAFTVFNYIVNKSVNVPTDVIILTAFIIVFSIVISWFKDLPDMEGDSAYKIKTLAIVYSPKSVFITGTILITLTYLVTIWLKYPDAIHAPTPSFQALVLFYGNIILLVLFVLNSFTIKLASHASVQRFYKRFWGFFFAEYMLFLIAYIY
ncbi:MAG: homogentisate phytyltransferase [Bacteroidota bacterium]|nr:homogentisate phytyltransferase [Bacteroidota bacterium]